jgi:hypothetical protein
MNIEIILIRNVIELFRRYLSILPIGCMLLFPVTCDASPFPHSVFQDPVDSSSAHAEHHAARVIYSPFSSVASSEAHDHHKPLTEPQDSTSTDINSMRQVAGSVDGYQSISTPDSEYMDLGDPSEAPVELPQMNVCGISPVPEAPPPRFRFA